MDYEMAPTGLRLRLDRPHDANAVVLGVAGDVDDRSAAVLHDVVNLFVERGQAVAVDLADVASISPASVSALMRAAEAARSDPMALAVRGAPQGTGPASDAGQGSEDLDPYPIDLNSF
jgi:ABC-type transporter Mla MlaB component